MKSYQNLISTLVYLLKHRLMFLMISILFFACKEEIDTEKPKVVISKPYENQLVSSVDTFVVEAVVSDNEQLTSVEIDVVDENFVSVIAKQRFETFGNPFYFYVDFDLNAPHLESGMYHLVVRARDGLNIGQGFKRIQIAAIPLELNRIFAVSSGANNVKVFSQSSPGSQFEEVYSANIDFAGAALNYHAGVLGIAGGEVGDCVFHDVDNFEIIRSIPGFGLLSLPYFLGLKYQSTLKEFLLLNRGPQLLVADGIGQLLNVVQLTNGFLSTDVFASGNQYFVGEKQVTGSNHLLTRYVQSGLLMSSHHIEGPVRGVFEKSENEHFVWIDAPNQIQLKVLNQATNGFSTPYMRDGEQIYDVAAIGASSFVLASSAGILRYIYGSGGAIVLNSNVVAQKVYYERLSETLYCISGNEVYRLSLSGAVIQEFTFSQNVEYIGFEYNR